MEVPSGRVAPGFGVVQVSGPDALSFLQGLLTQNVEIDSGSVTRSFLLEPRGKVRVMMWVCVGEQEALLISQQAQFLADTLSMYRIRVKAEIVMTDLSVILEVGSDFGHSWTGDESGFSASSGSYRFHGGADLTPTMSEDDFVLARILLGEPEIGVDLDGKAMVHETSLVGQSVDFDKGCYLGQELVSRIEVRGRSNQRTVYLQGTGIAPETGSSVALGGKAVGTITSVTLVENGFIGLGMVRREAEEGMEVLVGSTKAVVKDFPLEQVRA